MAANRPSLVEEEAPPLGGGEVSYVSPNLLAGGDRGVEVAEHREYARGAVVGGGDDTGSAGIEGDMADRGGVASENRQRRAGLGQPNTCRTVFRYRCDVAAVGAEYGVPNLAGMAG